MGTHTPWHVCGSQKTTPSNSLLSLCGSLDLKGVFRLGSKHRLVLSHLIETTGCLVIQTGPRLSIQPRVTSEFFNPLCELFQKFRKCFYGSEAKLLPGIFTVFLLGGKLPAGFRQVQGCNPGSSALCWLIREQPLLTPRGRTAKCPRYLGNMHD